MESNLLDIIQRAANLDGQQSYAIRKIVEVCKEAEAYHQRGTYFVNGKEWTTEDVSPVIRKMFRDKHGVPMWKRLSRRGTA